MSLRRRLADRVLAQASREYPERERYATLALLGPLFLLIAPAALVLVGHRIDSWLGLPAVPPAPANVVLGALLAVPSGLFALWSIHREFTLGRGTPIPLVATQELVVAPPYSYCRNPMALGTIGMYLGVAVLARSPGAGLLVLVGSAALLTYIRRAEEAEMEARFGAAYLAYRQRTPFLIPRFRRHG